MGTSFYFRIEVRETEPYPAPSLPVLRIQDGLRTSEDRQLPDPAIERLGEESTSVTERSTSREEHGRVGQSRTTLGRKMENKMKDWWTSTRHAERKAAS